MLVEFYRMYKNALAAYRHNPSEENLETLRNARSNYIVMRNYINSKRSK